MVGDPVLLGATLRLALAIACASLLNGDEALQDNRPASTGSEPAAAPRSAPVQMSWWTRGGEPGPGYSSDKLELAVAGETVTGTYIRARFDASNDPPFKAEQFTGDVPPAAWDKLRAALDDERVFGRHFPSEDQADLADALKDTVELSTAGQTRTKSFYGLPDADLARSRAVVKDIAAYLAKHGRHSVRKQS